MINAHSFLLRLLCVSIISVCLGAMLVLCVVNRRKLMLYVGIVSLLVVALSYSLVAAMVAAGQDYLLDISLYLAPELLTQTAITLAAYAYYLFKKSKHI